MDKENQLRMEYLEEKAKKEFIMNCDWSAITEMLSEKEQRELNELYDLFEADKERRK